MRALGRWRAGGAAAAAAVSEGGRPPIVALPPLAMTAARRDVAAVSVVAVAAAVVVVTVVVVAKADPIVEIRFVAVAAVRGLVSPWGVARGRPRSTRVRTPLLTVVIVVVELGVEVETDMGILVCKPHRPDT